MLRNLLFFIKEAFLSTKKNGIMSFATIVSLIATLLIVGLFLIISLNIDNILSDIESQLVAIVYLSDSATEEEVNEIIQNAIETEGVKEVK
ncbi:MAG: ABC transporter permease, partial [Candidatus Caldatribacteriota bacterium]